MNRKVALILSGATHSKLQRRFLAGYASLPLGGLIP
jgi:hypothetical protein